MPRNHLTKNVTYRKNNLYISCYYVYSPLDSQFPVEDSEANYINFIYKLCSKDNGDEESHKEGSDDDNDDDDWNISVVCIRGGVVVGDVGFLSHINLTDHRHPLTRPQTMAVNVSPSESREGSHAVPVVDRGVALIPGGEVSPGPVNPLIIKD